MSVYIKNLLHCLKLLPQGTEKERETLRRIRNFILNLIIQTLPSRTVLTTLWGVLTYGVGHRLSSESGVLPISELV